MPRRTMCKTLLGSVTSGYILVERDHPPFGYHGVNMSIYDIQYILNGGCDEGMNVSVSDIGYRIL